MAQLVDLIVDGGVLFNVGVRGGNVGLGLVVVIIGYKVFYCVIREKLLELTIELCCQSLIVRYYQSRLIQPLNDISHGKGLAGTRNP